jgi:hypothetical protein
MRLNFLGSRARPSQNPFFDSLPAFCLTYDGELEASIPLFYTSDDTSITVTEVDSNFHGSAISNSFNIDEIEKALYVDITLFPYRSHC